MLGNRLVALEVEVNEVIEVVEAIADADPWHHGAELAPNLRVRCNP